MSVDWGWLYSEAKGWQSAIGSVLGFLALIVGALFNFHLNRVRDQRLRRDEMVAIASAVYAEIILQRRSLARLANAVGRRYFSHGFGETSGEAFDKHFVAGIALPPLSIYPAITAKIGHLPSHVALGVVKFYARLEEVRAWLPRLQDDKDRPFTYGINFVLNPAIDAIKEVQLTLAEIAKMSGIEAHEPVPDINDALEGQDFEYERSG